MMGEGRIKVIDASCCCGRSPRGPIEPLVDPDWQTNWPRGDEKTAGQTVNNLARASHSFNGVCRLALNASLHICIDANKKTTSKNA